MRKVSEYFSEWLFIWLRYLFCCSYTHNVAAKGKYIAFVTTEAETDDPQTELKPGIDLLGPVDEIFFDSYDRYEPCNDHESDNCFISTVRTHKLTACCIPCFNLFPELLYDV